MGELQKIHNKNAPGANLSPWPKNTAGRKMISKESVPIAQYQETIEDLLPKIRQNIHKWETINYLYVVARRNKLVGVISIKEIFKGKPETKISQIMKKKIVSVQPEVSQEKIAYLALENNLKAIPVIDSKNHFLGVVPSDKILSFLFKQARRDIHRLAGIYQPDLIFENILEIPLTTAFIQRAPWLLIGLIGGILAAQIIGFFELTLKENLVLAAFIPLMVYMSDAVGAQIQTFFIRDLAIHPKIPFKKYFSKQLLVTFLISLLCGGLLSMISFVLYRQIYLGLILGFSMVIAICSAIFSGLIIPYLFNRLKIDPAVASGPLATIFQDIITVIIYLGIASWLLL